jgi:hypothetical protein
MLSSPHPDQLVFLVSLVAFLVILVHVTKLLLSTALTITVQLPFLVSIFNRFICAKVAVTPRHELTLITLLN